MPARAAPAQAVFSHQIRNDGYQVKDNSVVSS